MRTAVPRYESAGDAGQRLQNTFLRYSGVPVFIDRVRDDQSVEMTSLVDGTRHRAHASDVELDVSSPPIGYVNWDGTTLYGMRDPARRFRQGLSRENTKLFSERTLRYGDVNIEGLGYGDLAMSILDNFPAVTLGERHAVFRTEGAGVALSRRLAVVNAKRNVAKIRYRGQTIGILIPNSRAVLLGEFQNSFFEGELDKVGLR